MMKSSTLFERGPLPSYIPLRPPDVSVPGYSKAANVSVQQRSKNNEKTS